jgi:hypothetical protein
MNKLIVESNNDKIFIEALVQHLHIQAEVDTPMCKIDDFECLDGLSPKKLTIKLEDLLDEVGKKDVAKIGVLIDMDNFDKTQRLIYVRDCLNKALENKGFSILNQGFDDINQFLKVTLDEPNTVEIACFFTNLDGKGELETVLKAIKTKDSMYADCLEKWEDCLKQKGKTVSQKEFDKFWVNNYLRYDTCSKDEQKQAGRKCTFDYAMKHKSHIFDLNSLKLSDLKAFLLLFN